MVNLYKSDGLTSSQVTTLDNLCAHYSEVGAQMPSVQRGIADQASSFAKDELAAIGLNMEDPVIHFAVLAGASIMSNYVNYGEGIGSDAATSTQTILNALVNARPVRDID